MIICRNCKYCAGIQLCNKTLKFYDKNIVTGYQLIIKDSCWDTRNNPDKCGVEGKWFEPKWSYKIMQKLKEIFT